MKITLVNVSGRMSSDGSRLISALLKRAGHEVKSVFLARREPLEYQRDELARLEPLLDDCELVLTAVYSSYAVRAVQLSDFVHDRYPGKMVVWGGPHCISVPEPCLRHADAVCFSEGDEAVVDLLDRLAEKREYLDTPNMAFRVNGVHRVNEILPPFTDLDSLPYYDYDLEDHYLLDRELLSMTRERFGKGLAGYPFNRPILFIVTSRGCPHICSYCNNSRFVSLFGRNTVRHYSVGRVIEELENLLAKHDLFEVVALGDDDFFTRPLPELDEFARLYKRRIGLPFGVAISANTFREEKMNVLLDAGLKLVQMGVQSGSQRILDEVYQRKIKVARTRKVVGQIETFRKTHGLQLLIDIIIDNPYEKREDIVKTLKYLLDLPPSVKVNLFFLAFFPGTPIHARALSDGIIDEHQDLSFRFYASSGTNLRYQKNYETFLLLLADRLRARLGPHFTLVRPLLRLLSFRPIRTALSILPGSFWASLARRAQA